MFDACHKIEDFLSITKTKIVPLYSAFATLYIIFFAFLNGDFKTPTAPTLLKNTYTMKAYCLASLKSIDFQNKERS